MQVIIGPARHLRGSPLELRFKGRFFRLVFSSPTGVEPVSVLFGRIYAHALLLPLAIRRVLPAVNASPERKSAPKKLQGTFRRGLFEGFCTRRTQACRRKSRTTSPKAPNRAAEMRHGFDSRWTNFMITDYHSRISNTTKKLLRNKSEKFFFYYFFLKTHLFCM